MLFILIFALAIIPFFVRGDDCQTCVKEGDIWCVELSQCFGATYGKCNTTIKDVLNCPMSPPTGFEYSDEFARTIALPMIAATAPLDPTECLKNNLPSTTVYSSLYANCSAAQPGFTCHVFIAIDPTNKAILVAFQGTSFGNEQLSLEVLSFLVPKPAFLDIGHINAYFYESFYALWNGGLQNDANILRPLYPDYSIWVFGHSLGGAQASIYASLLIKTGLYLPAKVRLLTFGQPRTGDREFAKWHDETFFYSYRVIHRLDIAPQFLPDFGADPVFHHRFEVWYNNDMAVGDSYEICPQADGFYCSGRMVHENLTMDDHLVYFGVNPGEWGKKGCPKL